MKKTLRTLMMAAACWGLFSATSFALEGMLVKADVPFSFVAGSETLPAGSYVFRVNDPTEPAVLSIESPHGKEHELLITETESTPHEGAAMQSKLVFDRYGSEHYLAEVWVAGEDQVRAIPMNEIQQERTRTLEHERMSIPLHKVG
jgi:hypothetical protein